jgi:hypothetical protein
MTSPSAATTRGFLITFQPCGHVQHWHTAPEPGMWVSCWAGPRPGCQTPQQVQAVTPCPGCPDCWQQPDLFGDLRSAA